MSSRRHISLAGLAGFDVDDAVEQVCLAVLTAEILLVTLASGNMWIFPCFSIVVLRARPGASALMMLWSGLVRRLLGARCCLHCLRLWVIRCPPPHVTTYPTNDVLMIG